MDMHQAKTPLNQQILDEAAAWFIDFCEVQVNASTESDFNDWLRRSPDHVKYFLQISNFWEDAEVLKTKRNQIEAIVARAQRESNIHPLDVVGADAALPRAESEPVEASPAPISTKPSPAPSHHTLRLAVAATVVFAAGASAWWYVQHHVPAYATQVGEQRLITLEDGSSVELNARSRLKVDFNEDKREVKLLEGQALFRVAKDSARPFVVTSGDTSVRAVGTAFDVYRKSSGTIITVVEGRVAILSPTTQDMAASRDLSGQQESNPPLLISAGEQVRVTPRKVEPAKAVNVAIATAWTEKKMVFQSTPLREVVEEFNRYHRQRLIIADPALADLHVSAIVPMTDSDGMVEFLRRRFEVVTSANGSELEIR